MVNVNELKIGEFYKFIIEEVVDEEKKNSGCHGNSRILYRASYYRG